MIVMKFGGSTMASTADIRNVAQIIGSRFADNPVIVVSAFKGVTDALIRIFHNPAESVEIVIKIIHLHRRYLEELGIVCQPAFDLMEEFRSFSENMVKGNDYTLRAKDKLLSFGERLSVMVLSSYLGTLGMDPEPLFSDDLGFITNNKFGTAEILPEGVASLKSNLTGVKGLPVITGFIGKTKQGDITTVGRSGSDYTATVIGSALGVGEVQIWTDVAGVMTADPNIVASAKSVDYLTFDEAAELAYFGTKFLHPKCILPALKSKIPLRILSTNHPEDKGTLIADGNNRDAARVKAIVHRDNLHLLSVHSMDSHMSYGFLVELFHIFNRHGIPVDSVATTENSVSVTVGTNIYDTPQLQQELDSLGNIDVKPGRALISIIGEGLRTNDRLPDKILLLMTGQNIPVDLISGTPGKINFSFILDRGNLRKALTCLHHRFIENIGE